MPVLDRPWAVKPSHLNIARLFSELFNLPLSHMCNLLGFNIQILIDHFSSSHLMMAVSLDFLGLPSRLHDSLTGLIFLIIKVNNESVIVFFEVDAPRLINLFELFLLSELFDKQIVVFIFLLLMVSRLIN